MSLRHEVRLAAVALQFLTRVPVRLDRFEPDWLNACVRHFPLVGALVGAAALVPNRMEVPENAMALGVPAKIKEGASNPDVIAINAAVYVQNVHRYRHELRRID